MFRKMKKIPCILLFGAAISGCFSYSSPYDYAENWIIREDPARTFSIPADVFYVPHDLYTNVAMLPPMNSYVRSEVGNGRFSGTARVFSPLIATEDDLENALRWYFKYHHNRKRPLFFIGEGLGGSMLQAYEQRNARFLKVAGFVKSFYTKSAHKGFVTDDMVKDIKQSVVRTRFRAIWGRDMVESAPQK